MPTEPTAAVHTEPRTLTASDGFALSAELIRPTDAPIRIAALLAPAMAVPKTFYRAFAAHLARRGVAVLSLDYRGVGGSRPDPAERFDTTLTEWAERDLPAAVAHLKAELPSVPRAWIGHSVGGQLLGVTKLPDVDRAVLIASQSGYWRHWSGVDRLGMLAMWYAVMPLAISLTGHVPMRAFRQGENLPAGVGQQWMRAGRRPRYLAEEARQTPGSGFETFSGALRAYAISDDRYAPPRAVRALVREFESARGEVLVRTPGELGRDRVGHFGVFRRGIGEPLWDEVADWLVSPS